ncbi:MAG: SRPBCC family protein [Gemmatimonadales bacterium]
MKWVLIVVAAVVGLVGVVALGGALLPRGHTARHTGRFRQPPDSVWRAITDFASAPSWRADVRAVERLPDRDGHPVWQETDKHGQRLPLEVLEFAPPRRLVLRIADPKLPFGGTWTYEISPVAAGSSLTITEDGEIYNPIFRFVARFILGYTATMKGYVRALGRRFGEDVVS